MARHDSGLFWEDTPKIISERKISARPRPPVPETGWRPPSAFPDLRNTHVIALDVETYDPELDDYGPGWARGRGHVVGLSVAVGQQHKWYFPIRHEHEPEYNLPVDNVLRWANYTLSSNIPKVGANLIYDVGWLQHEGVCVRGKLYDVQNAQALLDESGDVNLDHLALTYLQRGKETNDLYQWLQKAFARAERYARKDIYRASPRLVGPYAEEDAALPLEILKRQWPLLAEQKLLHVFDIETRLIPLLIAMRFAGVRVDLEAAERLYTTLAEKISVLQSQLNALAGMEVVTGSGPSMARAFEKAGIDFPHTAAGNPSFGKNFLESVEHPIAKHVLEIRKLEKFQGTFVKSYVLDANVNGKIYCQFNQLRGDADGTRSGRFSSTKPNLQNIPSRDAEIAKMARSMYIPDSGHKQWRKYDYSQIEYRMLAHYAVGEGADDLRQRYKDDPRTDYHVYTQDMVKQIAGLAIERKPIKNINFGLLFGMGELKLARDLHLQAETAKNLFAGYHTGNPYVGATMKACMDEANLYGFISTILGRRSRFNVFGPANYRGDRKIIFPLPYEDAVNEWGAVERWGLHKAINRRLQGSAADLLKMAMVLAWESGVFARTGVPRLTVHDELDFSDPGGADDAFRDLKEILENAIPLKIPVIADVEIGPNWADVKEIN